MPSGGARLRSGPAPDPNALRRERDGKDWIQLPYEGRQGDAPDWPEELPEPSVAELAMWQRLWKMPQAVVWEADGVRDSVALYVRAFIASGEPDASVARLTLVRQMGDALLLSIPALHAARYTNKPKPTEAPAAPAASRAPATVKKAGGARALLQVVTPDSDDDGDE